MLYLIMLLFFGTQATDDFKLAAVARLKKSEGTAECITTNGDIEYWVNMATRARQTTKIIATGAMTMNGLTVNGPLTVDGPATLGGGSNDVVTIPGALTINATLTSDDILLNVYNVGIDGENTGVLTQKNMRDIILRLESKIAKLCKDSNVCGI